MILKDYQQRALTTIRKYLEVLAEARENAAKIRQIDSTHDWTRSAWEKCANDQVIASATYVPRKNGLGVPLPTLCLKIPTGGGKTLLATKVVDLVNTHYRKRQTGLVLWIVPTTQIYNQTLRALKDRDHPYRQQLDLASSGRTAILEKTSGFGPRDVDENLCVVLLMLPSANRASKEQLRMFRDSGGFTRFFPSDENAAAHQALLNEVPNLDRFGGAGFLGCLCQDISRQHAAFAETPDHPRRRPQSVQRQRQGNTRKLQSVHDRRAFRNAAARGKRAGRGQWPGTPC